MFQRITWKVVCNCCCSSTSWWRPLLHPFLITAGSPGSSLDAPSSSTQPELYLPLDWPPAHLGFGFDFTFGDWSEKRRKKLMEIVVRFMVQERQRMIFFCFWEGPFMKNVGRRGKVKAALFATNIDCCTPLNCILGSHAALWIQQQ